MSLALHRLQQSRLRCLRQQCLCLPQQQIPGCLRQQSLGCLHYPTFGGSVLRLVWFKRDLRIDDHAPLAAVLEPVRWRVQDGRAPRREGVLALLLIERRIWREESAAAQHYHFYLECCDALRRALDRVGIAHLMLDCEDAVEAFEGIRCTLGPFALFSHMETGDEPTYARDRRVSAWCRRHRIVWTEYRQFGVVRGMRERKAWASQWESLMAAPCVEAPTAPDTGSLPIAPDYADPIPTLAALPGYLAACNAAPRAAELGLEAHDPPLRQRGGWQRAEEALQSFLAVRSQTYRGGISSPLRAEHSCSRLSAYLAFGCLSMRRVVHRTRATLRTLADPAHASAYHWVGQDAGQVVQMAMRQHRGLRSFLERLHWHCHFIQKLESEATIAWQNMHRGYDGLRESDFNATYFAALREGRTGWPLVDASVKMLEATGWINFRMRAMLVSVAAYPLWLHWQPVGKWLATRFLDYEPGIHWSQMQMQSGTTGINTMRVYNPVKQAQDQDPEGVFVRRWLAHLRTVPQAWILEPWLAPLEVRKELGIPDPVVDLATATRAAKARVHALRIKPEVVQEALGVVRRHASMRSENRPITVPAPARRRTARTAPTASAAHAEQLSLDLGLDQDEPRPGARPSEGDRS